MKSNRIKITIGGSLLLLIMVGVGAYVGMQTQASQSSGNTLSERSQEYMASRKNEDDRVWRNVATSPRVKRMREEVSLENCFTLTVPFEVRYVRNEGTCIRQIGIQNPAGSIVVQVREGNTSSLSELSDVMLRRSKSDIYQERTINAGGQSYLTFVSRTEGYEQTAFRLTDKGVLSVSLSAMTTEDLGGKFATMIETVRGL